MYRRLLESYPAEADRYDEMLEPGGRLRPHWRTLIDQLEDLSPEILRRRAREVREAIAADGVTYNVYADPQGANRPWELDLLPQIISAEEWQTLSAAVTQRARLLNTVLADLYGPQTLLSEGLLPPALVFGQHGYLWPCRGIEPPGGIHLHLYAIDLARSPDGHWWVMSDRTQGPSGAGYALQNRQIMSRAMPDMVRDMHVQSLLKFFHTLHSSLSALAPAGGEAPLVVLLTPGPYNETYSEHAFLAHTLGFPLVEGADLMVRGDMVYLKTLSGLRRVHAILRRLDDDYCDPLELRADSALGIPGLVQAARLGNVLIANSLGSGVLESGALHGFLPAICERLLGQPLALPAVASWWCGEKPALEYTLANLEQLVIMPAFPSMRMQPVYGHSLNAQSRQRLIESLHAQPHAYVAQEWVRLSQAPVLSRSGEYRLMSRAVSLRVFVVAAADGSYHVMPGGLTRVAPRQRKDVVSMQQGGASKDVWVLGQIRPEMADATDGIGTPVEHIDERHRTLDAIRSTVDISSHAGENLFWMGRYAERCDNLAHLLRATLQRSLDLQGEARETFYQLCEICRGLGIALPEATAAGRPTVGAMQQGLIAAIVNPGAGIGIAGNLRHLHHCGYQVREHLSLDNWQALNRMPGLVAEASGAGTLPAAAMNMLNNVIQACVGLAGHALDDMTRDEGWHFLMLGRHIERMTHLATLFGLFLRMPEERQNRALPWLLESANSVVTYRVRYRRAPEWLPVLHLLVFDVSNPHGIAFQFQMLERYLSDIGEQLGTLSMDTPAHLSALLREFELQDLSHDSLFLTDANARLVQLMRDAITGAFALSDELARHFFTPLNAPVSQGVS
ncbi:A circularly permuted ATPgrasp family protein [Collimonas arenae]|uniref:A circularly permuted ATPgrasp family protein n=1 Tax=Collimonas arenae TaxID=279058 RepID=A0A127QN96_9BURK|nr:circularly permuted type 2 ATP-grasp protein [Collimonas arenae]AMP01682.1 A circularly permuted ATPgrasp family protein [Collimonas arenae]AMP11578.1 A circularly permuted ATPgrasp family protein [Collimonas arenae]